MPRGVQQRRLQWPFSSSRCAVALGLLAVMCAGAACGVLSSRTVVLAVTFDSVRFGAAVATCYSFAGVLGCPFLLVVLGCLEARPCPVLEARCFLFFAAIGFQMVGKGRFWVKQKGSWGLGFGEWVGSGAGDVHWRCCREERRAEATLCASAVASCCGVVRTEFMRHDGGGAQVAVRKVG
ncbi:hypothetical protein U1Q18_034073 [Sarracenia purpurea var. burkii]